MRVETEHNKQQQIDLIIEGAEGLSDYGYFMRHILQKKYPSFVREAMRLRKKRRKTQWLAPRGHSKTTTGTTSYATHKIVEDPDVRVLIVSNTFSQAEDMGEEVRQNLESERIIDRYGIQMPPSSPRTDPKTKYRWSNSKLSVRDRTRIGKESTLTCMGVFGPVISKHNEIILLDDIVDEAIADSETQRAKLKKWLLKTLLPCLEPGGELHIVGTRWHPLDIYQSVMDELDDFTIIIHKALNEEEDGSLSALWPERLSVEDLLGIRKRRGSIIFGMSYQNDVELAKGKIFKPEWFQFVDFEDVPEGGTVVKSYDLAIGEKPDADYFATCSVLTSQYEGHLRFYVYDVFRKRAMTFLEQADYVERNAAGVDKIVIEDVQYQKALKQVAESKGLPVKGVNPGGKSKVRRAYPLTSYFENKQVFFVSSINTKAMRDELLEFPDGEHDDLFDVVEMSIKESAAYVSGVRLLTMEDIDEEQRKPKEQYATQRLDGSDKPDTLRDEFISQGIVYPTCQKRGKVIERELSKGKNPCDGCPGREACHAHREPIEEIETQEAVDVRNRMMEDDDAWK